MDAPNLKPPNPFVGTRAILEGDPFFGRENDLSNLIDQLYAERIVLMYSPSGAGKTSLINAGVIPTLRKDNFNVLPILRLNNPLPEALKTTEGINRYSASIVSSLYAPDDPPDWQLAADNFGEDPALLIFDQFEEILTLAQGDIQQKKGFFKELGGLLKRPNLWALFALREDFLAALDPYRLSLPGQLRSRFRLDLLTAPQAVEVMVNIAVSQKVTFNPQAAWKLAYTLSGTPLDDQPDGAAPQNDLYVEPVHMQIVCYDLWENKLQPGDSEITPEMVAQPGEVDEALARHYANTLKKIEAEQGVKQRRLRYLFEYDLITTNKVRTPVQLGHPSLKGLEKAISPLKNAFLLNSQERSRTTWYELAHDRLINPILSNNQAWYKENLTPLQSGAIAWEGADRSDGLLLHGAELDKAEAWESEHPDEPLSKLEKAYLEASLDARNAEENVKKQIRLEKKNRRQRWLIAGLVVVVLIMGGLSFGGIELYKRAASWVDAQLMAVNQSAAEAKQFEAIAVSRATEVKEGEILAKQLNEQVATEQAQSQRSQILLAVNKLAEDSLESLETSSQRSLLLAAEAVDKALDLEEPAPAIALQALIGALASPEKQTLRGHTMPVKTLAVSPDGAWLATGGEDQTIRLWDLTDDDPGEGFLLTEEKDGPVSTLAFSPDGKRLVFGINNCVWLYKLSNPIERGNFVVDKDFHCQKDPNQHADPVHRIIISPDSRWLAVAGQSSNLWIYDLNNPENLSSALLSLAEHGGSVTSMAISSDSRWLAIGNPDGTIWAWDLSHLGDITREELIDSPPQADLRLAGHREGISALHFSPDSHWLASTGMDGALRLWDFQAGKPEQNSYILDNQETWAEALEFSPDGRLLAGAGEYNLRIWDFRALTQAQSEGKDPVSDAAFITISQDDSIRDIAFSPAGNPAYLAIASQNGLLQLVSLEEILKSLKEGGQPALNPLNETSLESLQNQINDLAFSPDGLRLFSASEDSAIRIWGLEQPSIPTKLEHLGIVKTAAFSPGGKWVVTSSSDGIGRIWEVSSGKELWELVGHEGAINDAAFSPVEEKVATASDDGSGRIWEASSGKELGVLAGHEGPVSSVAFSPDGKWVITASEDGSARIWEAESGRELTVLRGHGGRVWNAVFSPDGKRAATASADGSARIWDAASGKELVVLAGDSGSVNNALFSPDGMRVVTTSDDGAARLWDANSGVELEMLSKHAAMLRSVSFSTDGRWLATGGDDGAIYLWDMSTLIPILLPDTLDAISALAFDPNGRWLVSGNSAGIVRLWDLRADPPASAFVQIPAHKDWINTIAFSPDGAWLVTASEDGTAQLWPLDAEHLVNLGCQEMGTQVALNQDDWNKYLPGGEYYPACPR